MKRKMTKNLINSSIFIRPACIDDAPYFSYISLKSLGIPWSDESFREEFNNKSARYVAALDKDKIIGFAGIWIIAGEGDITNIAILEEYRHKGIGSMLLDAIFSICIKENANEITLEVRKSNLDAQGLYNKFGFKTEGIRKGFYSNNKEDALIMWNRDICGFINQKG